MGVLDILIIVGIGALAVAAVKKGLKGKGCGCCSMRESCLGKKDCR